MLTPEKMPLADHPGRWHKIACMKKILVLSVLLLCAGCKFELPLTEKPTRGVDPSLLGSWFSLTDGRPLDIYRLDGEEYLVINDGAPYVCSHSDLAGTSFVSCRQLTNDKEYYGKYAYMAYQIDKGDILLKPLNDSLGINGKSPITEIRRILEEAVKNGKALDQNPEHEIRFKKKASAESAGHP